MINMAPKYSVFLFCLVLFWTAKQCIAEGVDCCEVCSCVFNSLLSGTIVNCHNKGLSSVPSNIPLNTYDLDLSNNRLNTVRNYSFTGLKSLRFLNLGMNKIALLEKNAFTGLDNLRVLRLNQNILLMNYTTYPEMVFLPLSGLQELYIEDNFDKTDGEYADKIFKPLRELKILQLDTFSSPTFGEGFTHLKHLRRLLIGGGRIRCSMTILKNNTFNAFRAVPLDELVMTHCLLRLLEAGSFQFFPYLSILKIPENKVGVKNVLRSLNTLRSRNMTEINISKIRFDSHKTDLLRIDDSVLTTDVIRYLANICVTKIDLSRNRIRKPSETGYIGK
ncbi:leucine-rich repeat-containing protein 4-like [Gigantopelta aegis]|uniref:leucine-rich repeat-containing protein 4-like n=1 Tax=Gigantopelta aegis TaxID=1735272 RepID=UPI001B88D0F7|nr:leucine-rich repeat-containing protein 4-like [Gigantopelta aegis]